MASGELASNLRRFPRLLGQLLIAPGSALRQVEARESGGFSVLVMWCLVAAVALRFANLADAVVGFEAGGGLRVIAVLVGELTQAIPVALGAAVLVVALAGSSREPAVDLELGCAAAIPFLFARAAFRTAVIVVGREPPLRATQASYAVAGAWTLVLVVLALRIARQRPRARAVEAGHVPPARAGLAGWGALAVLVIGLSASVLWTARHSSALGPVSKGAPAPDFSLGRVDGQPGPLSLSSLRGQVVVLDFWATWCPPCLAALPMMHQLSGEMAARGVTFVGVNSDGAQSTPDEVGAFLRQHGAPYPVVYDDGSANERYRIKVLPTVIIVAKDGTVDRVIIGSSSKSTLVAAIDHALAR